LLAASFVATAQAQVGDNTGPRHSYFDAGYTWTDVNYAVKQEGGRHKGFKLAGAVGIADFGRVSLHLFGEFFDGDFDGVTTTCDGGEGGGSTTQSAKRDSQSIAGGIGAGIGLTETTDLVVRAAYVDISEFETPDATCNLVSGDATGYFAEALIRSELSRKVEVEAGVRYADLDGDDVSSTDSSISNTDLVLGVGYHVTDYLTVRARGVIFDDDTGLEIGARLYFGSFTGRDSIF
jgi:hypothetical protein